MALRNANLISILAKKLEKRGIENKGLTDMQAGEIAFYAELHDAERIYADNSIWVDLVISLPPWTWRKWFFTDEQGYPIYICFKFRWLP